MFAGKLRTDSSVDAWLSAGSVIQEFPWHSRDDWQRTLRHERWDCYPERSDDWNHWAARENLDPELQRVCAGPDAWWHWQDACFHHVSVCDLPLAAYVHGFAEYHYEVISEAVKTTVKTASDTVQLCSTVSVVRVPSQYLRSVPTLLIATFTCRVPGLCWVMGLKLFDDIGPLKQVAWFCTVKVFV